MIQSHVYVHSCTRTDFGAFNYLECIIINLLAEMLLQLGYNQEHNNNHYYYYTCGGDRTS